MLMQRTVVGEPEKIFVVAKNSYSTAALTNGQAVIWDYATDADGLGVTKPSSGEARNGHFGIAFAGIASQTIAAGDYGLIQVYGYPSATRVRTQTGTNPAITAGTGLVCKAAIFALESGNANAAATSTITVHNWQWAGIALAAQASFTTKAIAVFIKAM